MDTESVELLSRYRNGDAEAAEALYSRFVHRLIRLAKKQISRRLERRVDAEDIVQSAYQSFFARVKDGEFQIERSGDLWRLLAAITVNKVRRQAEFHGRQKRAVGREHSAILVAETLQNCVEYVAVDPGDEEAVAVADELESLMATLPERDRAILEMRLNDLDVGEISRRIGRSEWTVRRSLNALQEELEQRLLNPRP